MIKSGLSAIDPCKYPAAALKEFAGSQAQFARVVGVSPIGVSHAIKGNRN